MKKKDLLDLVDLATSGYHSNSFTKTNLDDIIQNFTNKFVNINDKNFNKVKGAITSVEDSELVDISVDSSTEDARFPLMSIDSALSVNDLVVYNTIDPYLIYTDAIVDKNLVRALAIVSSGKCLTNNQCFEKFPIENFEDWKTKIPWYKNFVKVGENDPTFLETYLKLSKEHHLHPFCSAAVISQESNWITTAKSVTNCVGLIQWCGCPTKEGYLNGTIKGGQQMIDAFAFWKDFLVKCKDGANDFEILSLALYNASPLSWLNSKGGEKNVIVYVNHPTNKDLRNMYTNHAVMDHAKKGYVSYADYIATKVYRFFVDGDIDFISLLYPSSVAIKPNVKLGAMFESRGLEPGSTTTPAVDVKPVKIDSKLPDIFNGPLYNWEGNALFQSIKSRSDLAYNAFVGSGKFIHLHMKTLCPKVLDLKAISSYVYPYLMKYLDNKNLVAKVLDRAVYARSEWHKPIDKIKFPSIDELKKKFPFPKPVSNSSYLKNFFSSHPVFALILLECVNIMYELTSLFIMNADGCRQPKEQKKYLAAGTSTIFHSYHLLGLACDAVDSTKLWDLHSSAYTLWSFIVTAFGFNPISLWKNPFEVCHCQYFVASNPDNFVETNLINFGFTTNDRDSVPVPVDNSSRLPEYFSYDRKLNNLD